MEDSLRPFVERVEALEDDLKRAKNRTEAGPAQEAIVELHQTLEGVEEEIAELKRTLHVLSWRYRALPVDPAASGTGADPSAPAFPMDDLASTTYVQKGWNCIAVGDYEGALDMLRRAVDAAPGDVRALSALGWAQTLSEDYDEALMTYQKVLATNANDPLAQVNLGYICLKKKIYGEAIEHLSKVVKSGEDRKATLYGNYYLGLVYLAREMYSDAVSFFEKAIELGPAMSEAYFQLGRVHYLAGREEKAVAVWKEGTAANEHDPWAERCTEVATSVEAGRRPRFE